MGPEGRSRAWAAAVGRTHGRVNRPTDEEG